MGSTTVSGWCVLALVALDLLCGAVVHAQVASKIELDLPECLDASWREQLISSATIELSEDGALGEDKLQITIAAPCADPSEAQLRLAHGAISRTVQLSDVPPHLRPRTLALALAELWRTSSNAFSSQPTRLPQLSAAPPEAHAAPGAPVHVDSATANTAAAAALRASAPKSGALAQASAGNSNETAHSIRYATARSGAVTQTADRTAPPRAADAKPALAAGQSVATATADVPATAPKPRPSAATATTDARSPLPAAAIEPDHTADVKSGSPARSTAATESGAPLRAAAPKPGTAAANSEASAPLRTAHAPPADASERPTSTASDAPALSLAPALRLYFANRNALPGAQLAFRWRAWRVGAEGYYSSHEDALGSARFGLVQGFLSWELARIQLGRYGLAFGPRAAVGGILAAANAHAPALASSASVLSWDLAGEAAFWRELTSQWRLALRIQLGYSAGTILASEVSELARLHGLFATAGVALELHLTGS